jgi:glutaredoxin
MSPTWSTCLDTRSQIPAGAISDGGKKAPQVFIDGRPVGGLRELTDSDRSDHLDRLMHGEI